MYKNLFILVIFLLISGCEGSIKEEDLTKTEDGEIDPRYYKGMYIYGNLKTNLDNSSGGFSHQGKLRIDELQATIYSHCRDQLIEQQNGITGEVQCFSNDLEEPEVNINASSCESYICAQSLHICAGYTNLKLAEAISPVKIKSLLPSYSIEGDSSGDGNYNFQVIPDVNGHYQFSDNFFTFAEEAGCIPSRGCFCEGQCQMEYTIPPQKPENKTLLYLAAKKEFELAGLAGMKALNNDDCRITVTSGIKSKKKNYKNSFGASQDLSEVFVREFGEVQFAYQKVTEKLNSSQIANAAAVENSPIYEEEEKEGENSRSRALENLVGNGAKVNICQTSLENDALENARDILRYSREPGILDESVPIENILANTAEWMNEDLGCIGSDCISSDDILNTFNVTLSEFQTARTYILEEQAANDRKFISSQFKGGQNRLYNLSERSLTHPPAYWESKSIGTELEKLDNYENIEGSFPTRSSLEFLNAMRNSTVKLVSDPTILNNVNDGVLKKYRAMAYSSNSILGKNKVVITSEDNMIYFNYVGNFSQNDNEDIILYLIREISERGNEKTDSGYRCALEGSIDGAPCDLSNYVIDTSNTIISTGMPSPFQSGYQIEFNPYSSSDVIGIDKLINAKKVWLFKRSGGNNLELITGFDLNSLVGAIENKKANDSNFQEKKSNFGILPGNLIIDVPVNSQLSIDLVRHGANKDKNDCTKSETSGETRWDFSLPNDYVPPLENAIKNDNDQYESSWRLYLQDAKNAAMVADSMGERIVDLGIDIEDRTSASAEQCQSFCGGVVNPDAFGESDEDIDSSCWEFERVDVSLGSSTLCRYRGAANNVELGWCECPNETECPPCPLKVNKNSEVNCETVYQAYMDENNYDWSAFDANSVEIKPVDNNLDIYQSRSIERSDFVDCEKIREMRKKYETAGQSITFEEYKENIFSQSWFNRRFFQYISSTFRLNPDPFFHYKIMKSGKLLWSTIKSLNQPVDGQRCPLMFPYREYDENTNLYINCEHCTPEGSPPITYGCDGESDDDWYNKEWFEYGSSGITEAGPIRDRIEWGVRFATLFKTIGIMAGNMDLIYFPVLTLNGREEFDLKQGEPPVGYQYLQYHNLIDEDGDPRICTTMDGYPEELSTNSSLYSETLTNLITNKDLWFLLSTTNKCVKETDGIFRQNKLYLYNRFLNNKVSFKDDLTENSSNLWRNLENRKINADWISLKEIILNNIKYGGLTPQEHWEGMLTDNPGSLNSLGELKYKLYLSYNFLKTVHIDGHRLFDALEFGCYVAENMWSSCLEAENMPEINSKEDILKMESLLKCVANEIQRKSEKIIIPNMPKELVDGFKASGLQSIYPGVTGEKAQIFLALDTNLRKFATTSRNIRDSLIQASGIINSAYYNISSIETDKEIASLRSLQNIIRNAAAAASGIMRALSGPIPSPSGYADAAGAVAVMGIEVQIQALQENSYNDKIQSAIQRAIVDISSSLTKLKDQFDSILDTYSNIQGALVSLDSLKNRAAKSCADATLEDVYEVDGESYKLYPNTVRRRRYATAVERYQDKLEIAKRLAYIARKSIEFRLGVDMESMHSPMTLVDSPSSWVKDLSQVTGIDYKKIRDYEEMDGFDGETGSYAHQYIGDYVDKLEAFVNSYGFDYPFHDGQDIAVISLRDDIKRIPGYCEQLSYNHVYYSGQIGAGVTHDASTTENGEEVIYTSYDYGWMVKNDQCCSTPECQIIGLPYCIKVDSNSSAGEADSNFCYFENSNCSEIDLESVIPQAERIKDATIVYEEKECNTYITLPSGEMQCSDWGNCPSGYASYSETTCSREYSGPYNGYVEQITEPLERGDYFLSFWHKNPTANDVNFSVEIIDQSGNQLLNQTIAKGSLWTKEVFVFESDTGEPVSIIIRPSAGSEIAGDVLIHAVQIEQIDNLREGCEIGSDYSSCDPLPYSAVGESRWKMEPGCYDQDGTFFRRNAFEYKCNSTVDGGQDCYYELDFSLSLEDIENGAIIPSAAISINNYNYRHGTLGINIVGTNVKECSSGSSSNCYSNAYLQYSLIHNGNVSVRNHEGQSVEFKLPNGQINNAKALASEVVLTNPLTGNHQSLMNEYMKNEYKGRPLTGNYTLRIWDDDTLTFDNIEDIQLVWRYSYWSRFGE